MVACTKWVWVKINPPEDRRFQSMLPCTRVTHFDLQPNVDLGCEVLHYCSIAMQEFAFQRRASSFKQVKRVGTVSIPTHAL